MTSLLKRIVRLISILDDVRSVLRTLELLRKLVRGLLRSRSGTVA